MDAFKSAVIAVFDSWNRRCSGQLDCVILEAADPLGPWGARGVSEMPYITYAPAVTAALYDAAGIWINKFPLTPSVVLEHLASAEI